MLLNNAAHANCMYVLICEDTQFHIIGSLNIHAVIGVPIKLDLSLFIIKDTNYKYYC